jgi:hypothetical protein
VHYCQEPEEFIRAWDITKRILTRLRRDVENNGGRLIVFTVPSMYEAREGSVKETDNRQYQKGSSCLGAPPGYKRLHLILNELGIDLIDLLPDFRRATQEEGTELFRQSDKHWNPEGHVLAAERVVSELMKKKLLKNSDWIPGENNQDGK